MRLRDEETLDEVTGSSALSKNGGDDTTSDKTKEVETHSRLPLLWSLEKACQSRWCRRNVRLESTMVLIQNLLLLLTTSICYGTPPNTGYGYQHQHPKHYLPAPPGETPLCAKHGETYCEHIENYPVNLIQHLIEKWEYDYNTLFLNEDREQYRPRPVYGPPLYHHKRPLFSVAHFQQQPAIFQHHGYNTIALNQTQDGYPDRRYPLGEANLHYLSNSPELYSALIRPELTANEPWWRRYQTFVRKKRQASSSISLCPTNSQFVTPKAALNNQGNWMYIVNQDSNARYTQLVLAETCRTSQCNGICSIPNGYSSRCEQQYVQKRLVALSGDGKNLYTDKFWLPHCCICQITQIDRLKKRK
ncbi:protein spaetzle 5 [Halyomorpha halys]|uniref:protein spaetzle 5 n=1 Tax=Halyomorpha halys TaxID=286706 RepID=UPI0006D4FA16|nr:protein spaetzle 5 [Halyomorpha halys]